MNINLVRDQKTGKSKGFCFICFEDQRSTVLSVDNLNGIKVSYRNEPDTRTCSYLHTLAGPFPAILGKCPCQNWEKMIDLTSKLGEINDIEHYKGSKIYPQNQVILDCIMPSIPLKHKCLSIILIWVSVSHK